MQLSTSDLSAFSYLFARSRFQTNYSYNEYLEFLSMKSEDKRIFGINTQIIKEYLDEDGVITYDIFLLNSMNVPLCYISGKITSINDICDITVEAKTTFVHLLGFLATSLPLFVLFFMPFNDILNIIVFASLLFDIAIFVLLFLIYFSFYRYVVYSLKNILFKTLKFN